MRKLDADVLVAGRFRLTRELGRGGMGAVWLAHHVSLDVPCAVKFIAEGSASDAVFRARFEREARAVARLRHPNVVQVYDTGVWEEQPYIAMELLEGEALSARLAREGKVGLPATVTIVAQVADALDRASELGILHRDLKPENIFLERHGEREMVKLLDFGIAKLRQEEDGSPVTITGAFVGTPQYMSPEQAHGGKDVDARSDLWSLAVVAYECVTGQVPFDGKGLGQVLQAVMSAPIPVPSSVEGSLPPGFDAWWARAAAREPDARFQSAEELANALAEAAGVWPPSVSDGTARMKARRVVVDAPAHPGEAATLAARVSRARQTEPAATLAGAERVVGSSRGSKAAIGVLAAIGTVLVVASWHALRAPATPAVGESTPAILSSPEAATREVPAAAVPSADSSTGSVAPPGATATPGNRTPAVSPPLPTGAGRAGGASTPRRKPAATAVAPSSMEPGY